MIVLLFTLWRLLASFLARRFAQEKLKPRCGCRAATSRRGVGRPKPAWVRNEVLRLKALTDAGCRTIAKLFNRCHAASRMTTVSKSYVSYTIRNHAYEVAILRRKIKHRVPRPTPANTLWGIDMTGKQDVYGQLHSIFGIVDHGTRQSLLLDALASKCAWELLGHLFLAMARHGKPRAVRTDNEAVFRSRRFRWMLAAAGIRQQFTVPGCPWQNGRIERFFGTLKER